MVEKTPWLDRLTWLIILVGVGIILFPIYYMLVASTLTTEQVNQIPMTLIPGTEFWANAQKAWTQSKLSTQLWNSFFVASLITIGKISVSILSAFAITYFDFRFRKLAFWMIFMTLMLPVEVRILPTYEVAANLFTPMNKLFHFLGFELKLSFSILDSYVGLTLPLIASATATFLFRQFFLTVPEELNEASKVDGATPMQFFFKILLPLSKTNIAALTVITFVYGWNQYLWPLLTVTSPEMKTSIVGIQQLIPRFDEAPQWNIAMAGGLIVMLPPILVVLLMQRWFVKGLVDAEK